MSLYTVLPSTPRLDELVAAVILGDQSSLPTKGGAVLNQYAWPREQEVAVKEEVFRRAREVEAAVSWATVKAPKTKLVPVRLISGELTTGPDNLAILLPFQPREVLEQAELQTWRKGTSRWKTKLMPGLILIHPSVCFIMPDNVPFGPLLCNILPSDNAKQPEGSEG
ncbi:hypothetical protein BU26DRAFT_220898 [Trematosphaeria pertusa]|uniref:Uncharacterized protein n=1 Tax=Trematosphaeria pertusa TaxID=390896 RepID=A0A6A6ISE0_9PLEO|nr:uncharacterized protein BU26DRAFT_220898 [Trematosphaeria pertusa]KAF2253326.1 hypothetical protein BU26DRAFT_220898 [Trematosphaeria pertusa]